MLEPPFKLLWCSWPRPVGTDGTAWLSEPEWAAPRMPYQPQPFWQNLGGECCWTIDWRLFFRHGIGLDAAGEMRRFHVVFEIEVQQDGVLALWADDGAIVRRNGTCLLDDRTAHPLRRSEIAAVAGDRLMIAHWQLHGDWLWGASHRPNDRLDDSGFGRDDRLGAPGFSPDDRLGDPGFSRMKPLAGSRGRVETRLAHATGPDLKMFTDGSKPACVILAIYSMILNGYPPRKVWLFGEHQWSDDARQSFHTHLPFAEVVPTSAVCWAIGQAGAPQLAEWAVRYWWVMKACASLFTDPRTFCAMDDDVLVLDTVEDAVASLATADLVYQADYDHSEIYTAAWGLRPPGGRLPSGRFNAGLYWMRNGFDTRDVARYMLRVAPGRTWNVAWEQGVIAALFASLRCRELPAEAYFYPLLDGLPGGVLGYDYRANPCGFKTIHFGGLANKPDDSTALLFARSVLRE